MGEHTGKQLYLSKKSQAETHTQRERVSGPKEEEASKEVS